MVYIFLVAGKGARLQPLTFTKPKSMFKLDKNTTLIRRMITLINNHDQQAQIIVVTGHMYKSIEDDLVDINNVIFVYNPFYKFTNSIASLWFARDYLNADNVVIIDGDIVMSEELIKKIVCVPVEKPIVLLDSSIKTDGDYNVEISGNKVLVMSKELTSYYGEYAGITKLDGESSKKLKDEIEDMITDGFYDQWYENALVQMIFRDDFDLFYEDICNYKWTEVDCVSDLIVAKNIHTNDLIVNT